MDIRDVTRARLRRPAGLRAAGVGVAMTPAITLVPSQDLRAHLSDYLQRARQGERITITVHGRPVAVLGPYDPGGTLEDLARVLGEEQGAMAGGEG